MAEEQKCARRKVEKLPRKKEQKKGEQKKRKVANMCKTTSVKEIGKNTTLGE